MRYKASRQRQQQQQLLQEGLQEELRQENDSPELDAILSPENILPLAKHNEDFNFHSLLVSSIQKSNFFRLHCIKIINFNELILELASKVNHLEPYDEFEGKEREKIASISFCLLFRSLQLK